MKPKKNPKADLNRRWVLFLQIGLIIVLLLVLQAIEWKSVLPDDQNLSKVEYRSLEEEVPPVTVTPEATPPPPPKPAPDIIEVIPDDADAVEDPVAPTDFDLDDVLQPSDIKEPIDEPEKIEKVPFTFVEDVPIFPGCEGLKNNDERKQCMSSEISKFINREFDTGLGQKLGLTGMNVVRVMFVVNRQGEVEQIQTRATHPELEKEAERVLKKLPKMEPGKQRGKPVPVSYSIPIRFKVQD